jgi:hypothetical protein
MRQSTPAPSKTSNQDYKIQNRGKIKMRTVRSVCCLALLAGALFCRPDVASAQGSDAERQACTPDAMRLCSEFIPDVAKVTSCMMAKRAQLSDACRVAMAGGGGGRHGHHHRARHCRHC